MTKARDNILSRLNSYRPQLPLDKAPHNVPEIPPWSLDERIERFSARLRKVRAEVIVSTGQDWPAAVRDLTVQRGFSNLLYGPTGPLGLKIEQAWGETDHPSLPLLVSHEREIDAWKHQLFFEIDAAITSTRAGIADTGTLVLWPGPQEPRSYSLVPPVHIAVIEAAKLYTSFEELMVAEDWGRDLPSNVVLISGPSKTADIEQTLAYGVHGPTELIVVLLR